MIRSTPELARFERWYARKRDASAGYAEALAIFTGLWIEAVSLRERFGSDWETDLEPDIAIARALNASASDA